VSGSIHRYNGFMRIGELARRTGVSERSLRYYEQQGMLVSDRTPAGQREYREAAVDRVLHIQELFAAGLHSGTIATLLPCMRDADGGPADTAAARLGQTLAAEGLRLDKQIRELANHRAVLDEIIAAAAGDVAAAPASGEHVVAQHDSAPSG
jgi:DNA-binding transcriptional MerR regulator